MIPVLNGYEYLITLDQEVTLFWRRKWTGATVLFFATRYLGLLSFTILSAATYAPLSVKVRTSSFLYSEIVLMVGPQEVRSSVCSSRLNTHRTCCTFSCTPLTYVQAYFSVSQYIAWAGTLCS